MTAKTKKHNIYYDSVAQLKPGWKDFLIIYILGRHICNCQARIHDLIRNCVNCGRITCAQEGSGPCFYCGALVVTKEQREVLFKHLYYIFIF